MPLTFNQLLSRFSQRPQNLQLQQTQFAVSYHQKIAAAARRIEKFQRGEFFDENPVIYCDCL